MMFAIFFTALFVSMVVIAGAFRLSPYLGLIDSPDNRKVHRTPIPRCGGIGMVFGVVVALVTWREIDPQLQAFLLGIAIISFFGIWDDRSNLNYKMKFAGQFLAVLALVGFGDVLLERVPFTEHVLPPPVAYPLTVFFLLGTTNAINLSDGLDGLASGLGLLSLAAIAGLAYLAGDQDLIVLVMAIVGSILGFLRFNTFPAKVFMGDTGSQFLGFSLGTLSVLLTQKVNTALNPALTLFVLGLPIVDTLIVMAQRMATGRSPFRPDRQHFHHKLLSLGFDHYETVVIIYLVQAVFVLGAYFLRYESDLWVTAMYMFLALSVALSYPVALGLRWRHRAAREVTELSPIAKLVAFLRKRGWLARFPYWLVSVFLPLFLAGQSLLAERIPRDGAYFTVALVFVAAATRMFGTTWALLDRLAIYSCAILASYGLWSSALPEAVFLQSLLKYLYLSLIAIMAISIRFSAAQYQFITPSDYLFLFILIAAANVPQLAGLNYVELAVEGAILLYAVEFVLRQSGAGPARLRVATILASFILLWKAY